MSIQPKMALSLAMAACLATVAIAAEIASGSHVHPLGATPIRVSLVPAFKACATPNRTHGAPLAFPSCAAPVQSSNFLTVGTPDANGAPAGLVGSILLQVKVSTGELLVTPSISDVRCLPGTNASVCNNPNAGDGPDYSGQLQMNATVRLSDHYNGPNVNEAATAVDFPFPVNMFCSNTTSQTTGGVCVGGEQPVCPPTCGNPGQRAVVELGQIEVSDGGADGNVSTNDNTTFLRQGIFIP